MHLDDGLIETTAILPKNSQKRYSSSSDIRRVTMIAFINFLSGGRTGERVLKALQDHPLLSPDRVFNLGQGGPKNGLQKFRDDPCLRVIVCGGDGTINWVLSSIHSLKMPRVPAVGIIPLGTGNDTARAFGWGSKFKSIRVVNELITHLATARRVPFDRWHVCIQYKNNFLSNLENELPPAVSRMERAPSFLDERGIDFDEKDLHGMQCEFNNYLSFGVDAQILMNFHEKRENSQMCFCCRCCAFLWFGWYGVQNCCCCQAPDLDIQLEIVSEQSGNWETVDVSDYKGIILLNIQSYAAGMQIWPDKGASIITPAAGDGVLEIVGVKSSCHLGFMTNGCQTGVRIGQAKELRFTSNDPIFAQIDGEPWKDKAAVYHVRRGRSANMLIGPYNCAINKNAESYLHSDTDLVL